MKTVACTLLTDGSSDRILIPVLEWLLRQHQAQAESIEWCDPSRFQLRRKELSRRIRKALDLYPCDLLFIHRDAEGESPEFRESEIRRALEGSDTPAVFVIPVRMTEAWFLFDENVIREAAGCPQGTMALGLPSLHRCEDHPDPKVQLHECLRKATGKSGRHLAKFEPEKAAHRLAELIPSYAPLRTLPAFQRLEQQLEETLQRLP